MANPVHSNLSIQNFAPDQVAQAPTQDGEWMFLQRASEVTGLHEKTLRRYIKKKVLKWKRLGKQTNSPLQVWITPEVLHTVEAETSLAEEVQDVVDDEEPLDSSPVAGNQQNIGLDSNIERVLKILAQQFADKLDEQKQLIFEMRGELVEKEKQLMLLPDLQKKMEETEKLSEFERSALQKQVEELRQENEKLRAEAEMSKSKKGWWGWFLGRS
jgi:hypothetical protein